MGRPQTAWDPSASGPYSARERPGREDRDIGRDSYDFIFGGESKGYYVKNITSFSILKRLNRIIEYSLARPQTSEHKSHIFSNLRSPQPPRPKQGKTRQGSGLGKQTTHSSTSPTALANSSEVRQGKAAQESSEGLVDFRVEFCVEKLSSKS